MLLTSTAAVGSGLAFSLLLSTFLVRPLREMSRASDRIAEGDYDVVMSIRSNDELGNLASKIVTMSRKLQDFHQLNVGKLMAENNGVRRLLAALRMALLWLMLMPKSLRLIPVRQKFSRPHLNSPKVGILLMYSSSRAL
jgi:NtrC-family two-component system sensor histidine kinase KinB